MSFDYAAYEDLNAETDFFFGIHILGQLMLDCQFVQCKPIVRQGMTTGLRYTGPGFSRAVSTVTGRMGIAATDSPVVRLQVRNDRLTHLELRFDSPDSADVHIVLGSVAGISLESMEEQWGTVWQ